MDFSGNFRNALSRKPGTAMPDIAGRQAVGKPADPAAYEKHSKDWYRLNDLADMYKTRPAREVFAEMTEADRTLLGDLHRDPSARGDDIARLVGGDFELQEMVQVAGHVFPMMDSWIESILGGKKFTGEQLAFKRDWVQTITDRGHVLYAYWKPSDAKRLGAVIKRFGGRKGRPDMTNLNWIDTSEMTALAQTFEGTHFSGDISLWDTSRVRRMWRTFAGSDFNGDISGWDFSSVETMNGMFMESSFSRDLPGLDLPKLEDANAMFMKSSFTGDISGWKFPNLKSTRLMFAGDTTHDNDQYPMTGMNPFSGDLSSWDMSGVTDAEGMFKCSWFDSDISGWRLSRDCNTNDMFRNCEIRDIWKPWQLQDPQYRGKCPWRKKRTDR